MFDDSGRPTGDGGYGQYSPFQDSNKPPGPVQDPKVPPSGGGTPAAPTDPTLAGWRSADSQRQIGQPHGQSAPYLGSSLQQAITARDPTMNVGGTSPTGAMTPAAGGAYGNLSDPHAWMSLVGNDQALNGWVKEGLGPTANPELINYYTGKIKGQPGANPMEQQGSADYWMNKLKSDPSLHGGAPQGMAGAFMGGLGNNSALMSALGNSGGATSLTDTGSNNPLLTAIRQQMMGQAPQVNSV